jgi:Zn-dependent M28 family amino/carboxypeptidase
MRLTLFCGRLAALSVFLAAPAQAQRPVVLPEPHVAEDVAYLASDALGGRLVGTPGADSAAEYLARRFAKAGLQRPQAGWFQEFTVSRESQQAQKAGIGGATGRNVIGLLHGRDKKRRDEVIVVGAHYDHLGGGLFGALDPDSAGRPHNGADDNASGVATMLEVAQRLAQSRPDRTIVFVAFTGEELGLLGSAWYVRNPVAPLARTTAMINFDMVGRLTNERLIVYGTETAKEFPALLDSLNRTAGFDLKARGDGYGPSDQSSFYAVKLPVLHLFTDLHEDYHRATDDAERLNVPGMLRVAEFTTALVRNLADRRAPLTFVDQPPPQQAAAPGQTRSAGYGAYLGSVPDMAGDVTGVKLSGVRGGSPAEKAGMQRDDIITKIGDADVLDLQGMTDALRVHKPGDVVDIVVLRGGQPVTLKVTLGSRGG